MHIVDNAELYYFVEPVLFQNMLIRKESFFSKVNFLAVGLSGVVFHKSS